MVWFKTYKNVYSTLHMTTINKDIMHVFEGNKNSTYINIFALNVAITLLHKKIKMGDGM